MRSIAAGKPLQLPATLLQIFQRCQLNWHAQPQADIVGNITRAFKEMTLWDPEVIFQLDGENDELFSQCTRTMGRVSGLFDLSHGTGVLPKEWPAPNVSPFYLGYAGGLGPDNLREELPKIHAAASGDYWIDMETKLFDGLQFSLQKCIDVLDIVDEFNADKQ